jgi:hypothetical protein
MNPYRVKLAHGLNAAALVVLAVFAVALVAIGIAVALGAERFHEAQPQTSTTAFYASGAVTAVIGILFLIPVVRGWGVVSSIDLAADGGWKLRSRFGRPMGEVAAETERRIELVGRHGIVWSGAIFRREPRVGGTLIVGEETRYRLAISGPVTYERAISELGYDAAAPRPGEELVLR